MLKIDTASDLNGLFDALRTFLKAGGLARATLTLTGNAGDGDTVAIGQTAAGLFTLSGQPADTETVTIAGKVYTFSTVLVDLDGYVLIGGTTADSRNNLVAAINRAAGQGVLYANATTLHATVEAAAGGTGEVAVRALEPGTAGNAITTTETVTNGAWGAGTLTGGVERTYTLDATLDDGTANHVQIGASASDTLDNLIAAINKAAGAGTAYSTATTTAHADVAAAAGAGDTLTLTARRAGPGLNQGNLATDVTGATWSAATLLGGEYAWVELQYDGTNRKMLLRAPGLAGVQSIYFGFDLNKNVPSDTYTVGTWMFKAYNPALTFYDQPGTSAVRHMAAWDSTMPYWFIANGQRLILVTKVSTTYPSSYVGQFLPYGTPGEYPQPWVVIAQFNSSVRFSTTSQDFRSFFDPSEKGCLILSPDGNWRFGGNYSDNGGGSESTVSNSTCFVWPFSDEDNNATATRYRELRDNVDGSYTRFPLKLTAVQPSRDIWGELDGAYAVPAFAAATEDTITEAGLAHLVVQNVFRTARYYYAAIALA